MFQDLSARRQGTNGAGIWDRKTGEGAWGYSSRANSSWGLSRRGAAWRNTARDSSCKPWVYRQVAWGNSHHTWDSPENKDCWSQASFSQAASGSSRLPRRYQRKACIPRASARRTPLGAVGLLCVLKRWEWFSWYCVPGQSTHGGFVLFAGWFTSQGAALVRPVEVQVVVVEPNPWLEEGLPTNESASRRQVPCKPLPSCEPILLEQ